MKRRAIAIATVAAAIGSGLFTSGTAQSLTCGRNAVTLNKTLATGSVAISFGLKKIPVSNQTPFVTGMRVRVATGNTLTTTKYVEGRVGRISNCVVALQVDVTFGTGTLKNAFFAIAGEIGPRGLAGPQGNTGPPGVQGAQGLQGVQGIQGIAGLQGVPGITGANGADGFIPSYGTFYDTTTQVVREPSTPTAVMFNEVTPGVNGVLAKGISVDRDSNIKVDNAGIYKIQFSAQLSRTEPGKDDMDIWLRVDGRDVPWSDVVMTIPATQRLVAAWNFVIELSAGQSFEMMFSTPDAFSQIVAVPPQNSPDRPGIPSVSLSVLQVQ